MDFDHQAGKLKSSNIDDNSISNGNANSNGNGNGNGNGNHDANTSYDEIEYEDHTDEYYDEHVTDADVVDVTTLQQNNFEVTTEPADLLTTNSDIVNEEIGPFDSTRNGSIVFEVTTSSVFLILMSLWF